MDAHGPYDLNLSSATGADWVKFGFSGDPVFSYLPTPKQNAQHFFAYLADNYRTRSVNGPGLYSAALRSVLQVAGVRRDGVRIRGELVMDYVESTYGDSGIESFQVRAAPSAGYATTIRTLRTIQRHITYTGSLT